MPMLGSGRAHVAGPFPGLPPIATIPPVLQDLGRTG